MKAKKLILKVSAIVLISIAVVTSCRKDNQAPGFLFLENLRTSN
jgi:hypothetical protein